MAKDMVKQVFHACVDMFEIALRGRLTGWGGIVSSCSPPVGQGRRCGAKPETKGQCPLNHSVVRTEILRARQVCGSALSLPKMLGGGKPYIPLKHMRLVVSP